MLTSCRTAAFACIDDTDCKSDDDAGVCQPDGYCSFPDPMCASGQRYGQLSGPLSGECVPADASESSGSSSDAGSDGSPGTTLAPSTSGASTSSGAADDSSGVSSDTSTGHIPAEPLLLFDFEDGIVDGFTNTGSLGGMATCVEPACPIASTSGPRGTAAVFDGTDCSQFAFTPELNTTDAFTIAMWMRSDDIGQGYYAMMAKPVGDGAFNTWRASILVDDMLVQTLHLHVGLADNTGSDINPPLVTDTWFHLAVTWDTKDLAVWLDGVLFDTVDGTIIEWDQQDVFIGCDDDHTMIVGYYFGALDDVRLYDVVLDAGEIAALASP